MSARAEVLLAALEFHFPFHEIEQNTNWSVEEWTNFGDTLRLDLYDWDKGEAFTIELRAVEVEDEQ